MDVSKIKNQISLVLSSCRLTVLGLVAAAALLPAAQALAQLSINDSGTASYSIPVKVPPGIAGMVPNVGLLYSGSAVNGPVGIGWTIQGLSTITRCAGDKLLDGMLRSVDYTINDKLCLDGQRLIITDSSGIPAGQGGDSQGGTGIDIVREYRTEKDIYARIRAYGAAGGDPANGPAYFRVWTKAGQIYEYGVGVNTTANAQINVQGRAVVAAWPVSRISDTLGNYVDFQYEQRDYSFGTASASSTPGLGHEWNLTEIRYTGNGTQAPTNKISFVYVDRTDSTGSAQDRSEAYHMQSKNVSVRLLSKIQTFVNWPASQQTRPTTAITVKSYVLTYDHGAVSGRSRLRKVAECAGDGTGKCMPPTSFDYSDGGNINYAANQAFRNSVVATTTLQNQAGTLGLIRADFNGDGKLDILRWSDTPSQNLLFLSTGTDGQYNQASNFNITDQNLFKSDGCYTSLITDIDGDGLPDILRYSAPQSLAGTSCSSYGPVYIYKNNGNGSFTRLNYSGPTLTKLTSKPLDNCTVARNPTTGFCAEPGDHPGWTQGANFYLVDVDGDGRMDIITTQLPRNDIMGPNTNPCLTTECTQVYHSNGDGTFTKISTNLANVSVYVQPYRDDGVGATRRFQDINRDGLVDMTWLDTRFFNKYPFFVSRGDGNFDGKAGDLASYCAYPLDINGDGLSDCLSPGATAGVNLLYTGEGNGAYVQAGNFNLINAGQEMTGTSGVDIGDFDGDGRTDIIRWQDSPTGNVIYLSNGDGTFRQSAFNLTTSNDQLAKSDGTAGFLLGDFTGRGNTDILRTIASPSSASDAVRNQLYTRTDPMPPDQLLAVTSPMGIRSTLTWVPITNSSSGAYGARYISDRGMANAATYPKVDVLWPSYVVATMSTDSGTGAQQVSEYSYAGNKGSFDGSGLLGFRQVKQQHPAPDGGALTVTTQYLQTGAFIGMASMTETRVGALNATSAPVISRTTNIYCDTTAANGSSQSATSSSPCLSTSLVKRPYLYKSTEEGNDLSGVALPTVTTTNTFNNSGDPTQIVVNTAGVTLGSINQTFVKTTTNQYQPDSTSGDAWILGRLAQSTVQSTVPNSLGGITTSAGSGAGAGNTTGGTAVLSLTCSGGATTSAPTPATLSCILSNTGQVAAASISYSSITGAKVSGPTGSCTPGSTCGTVTVTTGTAVGNYTGTLTATPDVGKSALANVNLTVQGFPALALSCPSAVATTAPTPATLNCSLSNTGYAATTSITYSSIQGAIVSGPTGACAAGASCGTVTVTTGSAAATYAGTLAATPNAGGAAFAQVSLQVKSPPSLSLSCPASTPSTTPNGAYLSCVLTNTGMTDASSISYSSINGLGISGPTGVCAGGATCGTVQVSTNSGLVGIYSGTLTATPNIGTAAVQQISLQVRSQPAIALACGAATTTMSPTPSSMSCTVTNNGQTAANSLSYGAISGVSISGPTGACAANSTCGTVTLTSGTAGGTYSGTLTVTPDTGSGTNTSVSLRVMSAPNMVLSCPSGASSTTPSPAVMTCSLADYGETAANAISYVGFPGVIISGPSSCPYSSLCGQVTITSGTAVGTYAGTVYATSSPAGNYTPVNVVLTVNPPATTTVSQPASASFGTILNGAYTSMQITITNTGGAAATGFTPTVTSPFQLATTDCGATLAAGASCTATVSYSAGCRTTQYSPNGYLNTTGSNFPSVSTTLTGTVKAGTCQ